MSVNDETAAFIRSHCGSVGFLAVTNPAKAENEAERFLSRFHRTYFHEVTTLLNDQIEQIRRGAVVVVSLSATSSYGHDYYSDGEERCRMLSGLLHNIGYRSEDGETFRAYAIQVLLNLLNNQWLSDRPIAEQTADPKSPVCMPWSGPLFSESLKRRLLNEATELSEAAKTQKKIRPLLLQLREAADRLPAFLTGQAAA